MTIVITATHEIIILVVDCFLGLWDSKVASFYLRAKN